MPKGIYERTPEHCAALSKAHTGVPLSPEHCAAVSAGKKGIPHSPEQKAAVSKAMTGRTLSPETRAAISKAHVESDAAKAESKRQRGGNDICKHHYIYDHNDLSKYTIKMTRKEHTILHNNVRALGIKVPHINTGHETADELKLMEYIKKVESEPKGL
jgi:hypothetical protein